MDIQALKIFVHVVEEGSFAAVARKQNIDASQVSRLISNLEGELGVRLFHRTTRHLTLSEGGEIYYSQVVSALETLESAKNAAEAITTLPRGMLRIAVSPAYYQYRLARHIGEFHKRYPDIQLDFHTSDIQENLASKKFDLAIRHAPSIDSDYVCTKLHSTRYKVVCSPGFLSQIKIPRFPSDVSNLPVVTLEQIQPQNQWRFIKDKEESSISVHGPISVSSPLAQLQTLIEGNGIGLMAHWLVEEDLKSGKLVSVFDDFDVSASSFDAAAWIIYLNRTHLPLKVRTMINFLKEKLG